MQLNKIPYKLLLAAIAIVVVGLVYFAFFSTPVVAVGDTIGAYYTGSFVNGTKFSSNIGGPQLNFTVGAGNVIPGFDQGVVGMKLNETKTITLPPDEAYGQVNPSLIVKVPVSDFGNQTVTAGMFVTQTFNGKQSQGVVTAVNATTATLDFNQLLAGQTLVFTIRVVVIHKKQ